MKRIIFTTVLLAAFAVFSNVPIFANGKNDAEKLSVPVQEQPQMVQEIDVAPHETIRIGILNGPTSIPTAYMFDAMPVVDGKSVVFEKFASPQALLPKMLKGEIDIGFMPANVAAKVYNSANGALLCVGVSGNGNLFLITKDKSVKSLSDLIGKTVSIAGQGATPEYLFRWLLARNAIPESANGVLLDYSIPTADIAAELLSDKIRYAVVPEPFATVATAKSPDVVRALNMQDEFGAASVQQKTYPLTVMVVRASYASLHAVAVRAFKDAFSQSCAWTVANPQRAGVLVQKNTLGLMAPIVANAIPFANFTWKDALDAQSEIEHLLSIFFEFAPDSIGGKLPDEGFYFK
ncbi:MAG: ABC transporter substrate-binding protein [Treponema sp.]|nr:ABC transporter substrate-binding protein [Treponema sp.]